MKSGFVISAKSRWIFSLLGAVVSTVLLTLTFPGNSAQATSISVQSYSPNVASASGGHKISVTGKSLEKVTRVRVGGVIQPKLASRTKTQISFVMPKMSKSWLQYGGYVGIEFMQAGAWVKASPKFLLTASRGEAFESAGLVLKLLETSRPSFVQQQSRYGDLLPSAGAQLHGVKLNVLNMQDDWIDLTCSFEVEVKVIDASFRRFSYLPNRHRIEGNPGCNVFMNPGFNADALWVFDVPTLFKIEAIEIKAVTFGGAEPRPYYFAFDSNQ